MWYAVYLIDFHGWRHAVCGGIDGVVGWVRRGYQEKNQLYITNQSFRVQATCTILDVFTIVMMGPIVVKAQKKVVLLVKILKETRLSHLQTCPQDKSPGPKKRLVNSY